MEAVMCPNGHENPPGQKFCGECGLSLTLICVNGHENAPGQKFCGECGVALGSETQRASIAPLDEPGERRMVTVMFADLVGFTPFSESRDPENVRSMLTRYFDRAQTIVERFGGEIDKFIGDAVTAFWGARQAQEDDAERAVRAALELVDAVDELGAEIGVPDLALRAGVLTGETSVGAGGNEKGLVVGDIVNTASRLQSVASPGTVYVGESTQMLSNGAIRYESVGTQPLKGKSLPIPTWRAVDVAAAVGGRGRADGLEAPFVGRDDEFRLLKDQVHAATRERRTHLVSILGEAGIGKSRLAWELQKYLDGVTELFLWHEGRSPAYGEGVTFWALGEMVRSRARIAETDDAMRSRTKLRTIVAEFVPDPDEQRWIEPRLAGLLGLADMPAGDRNELFAALRTFFQRLAESSPTILVFEDLHWADAGLLDFIEELVEWSTRHPILVITLARPDLLVHRPTWGSGRRNTLSTHLGPLPDDDMAELVRGLAPGIADDVVALIVERAEGIPLYAVEFVRMLLGSGALVRINGEFEMVGTIDELAIPDSLRSVIAARLDRLDPDLRALIQDAAVLGYSFTADRLEVFGTRPDLDDQLRSLLRMELLELDVDERSPERGQYRFVQSVIREVAYGRLAKRDRRDRHLLVARYYEDLGDSEVAAIVASHYIDAYAADPSEELASATRAALRRAAERAAQLHSNEQVLGLARRAIELTPEGPDLAALNMMAGGAARAMADYESAEGHAARALDWYAEHGTSGEAALAATLLGSIYMDDVKSPTAIEAMLPYFDPESASREQGMLAAALSRASMLSDRQSEAIRLADQAIDAAEAAVDPATFVDAFITKASSLGNLGHTFEATLMLDGAIDFAEEHDLGFTAGRAINNLMILTTNDGWTRYGDYSRRGMELGIRMGDPSSQRMAANLAWWLTMMLRLDEAASVLDGEGFDMGSQGVAAYARYTRGLLEWLGGGTEEALAEARAGADAFVTMEEAQWSESGSDQLALLSLLSGDHRAAFDRALTVKLLAASWMTPKETALSAAMFMGEEEAFRQAVDSAAEYTIPGRKREAIELQIRAGNAVFEGDEHEAIVAFIRWIELLQNHFFTIHLQEARTLFALLVPDAPESQEAADAAYRELSDAGAHHLLEVWKDAFPAQEAERAG
jgi:class 3 adenylate cyclase/tetratricopeptide (TPR) repeat protein